MPLVVPCNLAVHTFILLSQYYVWRIWCNSHVLSVVFCSLGSCVQFVYMFSLSKWTRCFEAMKNRMQEMCGVCLPWQQKQPRCYLIRSGSSVIYPAIKAATQFDPESGFRNPVDTLILRAPHDPCTWGASCASYSVLQKCVVHVCVCLYTHEMHTRVLHVWKREWACV